MDLLRPWQRELGNSSRLGAVRGNYDEIEGEREMCVYPKTPSPPLQVPGLGVVSLLFGGPGLYDLVLERDHRDPK